MSARTTWATRVPSGIPNRHFGCGYRLSCLFLVRSRQFGLGFLAGALYWWSRDPAAEPGQGQMGNLSLNDFLVEPTCVQSPME